MTDIIRCKYAGDKEDEFCVNCSGVTMATDENGLEQVSCDQCGGYEPEEVNTVKLATKNMYYHHTESDSYFMIKKGEEIPEMDIDFGLSNPITKAAYDKGIAAQNSLEQQVDNTQAEPAAPSDSNEMGTPPTLTPQHIITEIKAESGVSIELANSRGKTAWYKFSYAETRTIPEGADIEYERQALWDTVHATVDTQVEETKAYLQSL